MTPLVSVIIPAYNAADFIRRAIDSALAQSHRPDEILVIDDGSRDRTADIAEAYGAPVRVIRKQNGGPASARDLGAANASGEWLAFLDADDWWFPTKLAAELSCAVERDVGLVHCWASHQKRKATSPFVSFEELWQHNLIINSSVLIRRSAFEQLGGFNDARELISVEDYNLWIRVAASSWRIVTCTQALVHYTRGIGLSSNTEKYLEAQLHNVNLLGQQLGVSNDTVGKKYCSILLDFGRRALYERKLPFARRVLRDALARNRSPKVAWYLLLSSVPVQILNLKRMMANGSQALAAREPWGPEGDTEPARPSPALPTPALPTDAPPPNMLAGSHEPIPVDPALRPMLITTVDVEEDFDWSRPFSRTATDVSSMRSQHIAHRIFERFDVVPTYLIDYSVAIQEAGRKPLQDLLQAGRCNIGAQLHPWVTPPFSEKLSVHNSYPGNLPAAVELAKIRELTTALQDAFETVPRTFRAGRYGIGPNTAASIARLGYRIDTSVVPHWNFADEGGPDFRYLSAEPFWLDRQRTLAELPISAGLVGKAVQLPAKATARLFRRMTEREALPSILARLGLVERIKLTPEGMEVADAKRLVRAMLGRGQRIFVLTFHSPSLEPCKTPYVKTRDDLIRFLSWLEEFYTFFMEEVGGCSVAPLDALAALQAPTGPPPHSRR